MNTSSAHHDSLSANLSAIPSGATALVAKNTPISIVNVQEDDGGRRRYIQFFYQYATLADFDHLQEKPLAYCVTLFIETDWSGQVFRRVHGNLVDDILKWIVAKEVIWHVSGVVDRGRMTDYVEFSFDDLVVATEFKLRWG